MTEPFLDTNVLLRHFRQDHPDHSPRATALIERVERGEVRVRTSDIVVFETVFTLQRSDRFPRRLIAEGLLAVLDLPGIVLPGKRHYHDVFAMYVSQPLGFADCYHAAMMRRLGVDEILSFDKDFDSVEGIRRREP